MTTTSPIIEAADHAARHWSYASPRRIRRGDDEHRTMFARMLLDTFNPYKPAVIDCPKLEPEARQRLITLQIWTSQYRPKAAPVCVSSAMHAPSKTSCCVKHSS